jgi:hypothetical protein
MKKQVQLMIIATMAMILVFSFNGYSQELFSTIFNNEAGWDNPGGSYTSYNEKTYEEGEWFFHSTSAVRGTTSFDETFGGSEYSFRDRDIFSVHNTSPVTGMSGFSMQLRDWMTGSGLDRNLKISVDGGDSWETIIIINKAWFDAYQVYQEYIYLFPDGPLDFEAEEFMLEIDGGTNDNDGRINIGQFVALGEPSQVATPSFDPPGGVYFDDLEISITTLTPDASIYYTLDGSEPGMDDFLFTDPIAVDGNVTIKARAFKEDLDPSDVATAEYAIRVLLLEKDFEDDDLYSGGWSVYDYFEGANTWEVKTFSGIKFAEIRDYQSDPPYPHSWYISPSTDLSDYEDVLFSFESLTAFRTGDALSVHISEDYTGEGDPASASWTMLPAELDSHTGGGYGSWTHSGYLDLSDYSGTVYIGFEYESDVNNVGTWEINNILITASEEAALSNNAELNTFTVGGMDALALSGLVVDDPDTDPGAILYVDDFSDFFGVVVETQDENAEYIVTVNDIVVAYEDLEDLEINYEDVILVTVTAEDQVTVKYFKLTVLGENRILNILTPEDGDEFFTSDVILFSWEAENIDELLFELYNLAQEEPVLNYVVPGDQDELTEIAPNGIQGSYVYRLTDNNDPAFYSESEIFTIVDNVNPVLLDKLPVPGSVNVPVSTELTMTFDEDIMPGAGSIHVYESQGDELVESVAADSEQVIIDGDIAYLSLSGDLDFETGYYVLVDNTAIKDVWENFFEGIDDPLYWTFTTREDALICNGDFEYWFDGLPECWYGAKSNINTSNVLQYDDNPYSGSYAVQLINTGSSHQRFTSQATSVEDGIEYEISFWVKGQGQIRTGLYDDRETGYGYATYNDYIDVESDNWMEYSQTITAANTFDSAEFIFSLRNTDEAFGHLQLDFVTIEEFQEEPMFTVTFLVTDNDGFSIDDAVITFGDMVNEAGDYVFTDLAEGEYAYSVSRLCFQEASGNVVVSEDLEVEVMLELDIMPGDANGDGVVNVLDIIAIANYYAGSFPSNFCFHNADLNTDGVVNVLDVIGTVNIFADNKIAPFPSLKSETANVYLDKNGIVLDSDGTLAGIQFELTGDYADLGMQLHVPGHELIIASENGLLKVIIFSLDNKAIPAGNIKLLSFTHEADLAWSDALAGNLNARKVPLILHDEVISTIADQTDSFFEVYPNPASDIIYIDLFADYDDVSVSLIDANGRVVKNAGNGAFQNGTLYLNVGDLKPDIYFLKVEVADDSFIRKIIVK